jgi:hypothetical protein
MPTEKCIATLAFIFWLSLLSGCGDPVIKTENPFRDAEQSIQAGRTTRTQVHEILGSPNIQYPSGEWEVYKKLGNGIGLISIIPFPVKDAWVHYFLITYDKDGRVTAVGSGADWASKKGSVWEAWSGSGVYAGDVGFYTGTNQPFISVDQGGKADSAWVGYLRLLQHSQLTNRTSMHTVIRQLCRASSRSHPSAFNAIGKIYREGLYSIYRKTMSWHVFGMQWRTAKFRRRGAMAYLHRKKHLQSNSSSENGNPTSAKMSYFCVFPNHTDICA